MNFNEDDDLWNVLDSLKISFSDQNTSHSQEIICKCGSYNIYKDDNMYVCLDCSKIIDIAMDTSAEWRYYGGEDNRSGDPSRCGLPTNTLLPRSSLGSVVGGYAKDNNDLRCVRRLQVWNSMPYDERKLLSVFDKMTANTSNCGISSKVVHDAKVMYKQASAKKISRGDNNEGLIASCVYHACIINKVPRSTREISEMSNINPIILTKGNARFQTLMHLNVDCSVPSDFVSRFGSQLNLSMLQIQRCIKLANYLEKEEIINDNSATSNTAGLIYYFISYFNYTVSKQTIAQVCLVSSVTITKIHKHLLKYKKYIDKFIDNDFK
jgi:transcription initiation factor TFIIB